MTGCGRWEDGDDDAEDVSPKPPSNSPEYLGDGVYATFDGYQVWLAVNDHRAPPLVALEPKVISALVRYAKDRGMRF